VASVATVPLLSGCARQAVSAGPVLLYDPTLPSGREFAARAVELDLRAVAIEGDRISMLREMLASQQPASFWGLTRHVDQMLVAEVAREFGFRPALAVQHVSGAPAKLKCQDAMKGAGAIATLSGGQWPTAFAELAAGLTPVCDHRRQSLDAGPAMSWVLTRNRAAPRQNGVA
jgi:hypothetical protein